jgi:hypothetical protein
MSSEWPQLRRRDLQALPALGAYRYSHRIFYVDKQTGVAAQWREWKDNRRQSREAKASRLIASFGGRQSARKNFERQFGIALPRFCTTDKNRNEAWNATMSKR